MFRKIDDGTLRRAITISIDGLAIAVEDDEPVAAVLLRLPPYTSRKTPVTHKPRAPFCMMGACFDCLVDVDGEISVRSCLVRARDGMKIVRPVGRPDPLSDAQK